MIRDFLTAKRVLGTRRAWHFTVALRRAHRRPWRSIDLDAYLGDSY